MLLGKDCLIVFLKEKSLMQARIVEVCEQTCYHQFINPQIEIEIKIVPPLIRSLTGFFSALTLSIHETTNNTFAI